MSIKSCTEQPLRRFLASLVSAVLFAASMPGMLWGGAAFFALVPWGLATLGAPRKAWLVDWVFFFVMIVLTDYWIGYVSWVGAILVLLTVSVLMLPTGFFFRRLTRWMPASLALPLAWTVVEFLRTHYPIGGLPLSLLGFSQYQDLTFIQSADLFGVHFNSFLIAAINGVLLDWLGIYSGAAPKPSRATLPASVAVVILLIGNGVYGRLRPQQLSHEGMSPSIVAIQANISSESKGNPPTPPKIFTKHIQESKKAFDSGSSDLLIWSEGMFPYYLGDEKPGAIFISGENPYTSEMASEAEAVLKGKVFGEILTQKKTAFLTGCGYFSPVGTRWVARNAALLYSPSGQRVGSYFKRHLVPGGEYVPDLGWITQWADELASMEGFRGQLGMMVPGDESKALDIETPSGKWKFGVSICYDNAYSDVYLDATRMGAQFHIVLSNEGWYRKSNASDQLVAASVFRAIECRRALVRCTNTGISALVREDGSVPERVSLSGLEKQVPGTLRCQWELCQSQSLFLSWGEIPIWVCTGLVLIFAFLPRKNGN